MLSGDKHIASMQVHWPCLRTIWHQSLSIPHAVAPLKGKLHAKATCLLIPWTFTNPWLRTRTKTRNGDTWAYVGLEVSNQKVSLKPGSYPSLRLGPWGLLFDGPSPKKGIPSFFPTPKASQTLVSSKEKGSPPFSRPQKPPKPLPHPKQGIPISPHPINLLAPSHPVP